MKPVTVRRPPRRPELIYDGDCGFCRRWMERWRRRTGEAVCYRAFQQADADYPEIPRERFEKGVYFIEPSGRAWPWAAGVARLLRHAPGWRWLWTLYRIPPFGWILEAAYRLVARNRGFFDKLDRVVFR